MNWSEFFKSGALIQINASQYWVGVGPFEYSNGATSHCSAIFTPDFFLKTHQAWVAPRQSCIIDRPQLAEVAARSGEISWHWQSADFSHFAEQFSVIQKSIAIDEVQKAVPVTYEWSEQKPCVKTLLARLASAPGNLWAYGFWCEEGGIAGVTPEILFSRQRQEIETFALAGTRPKNDDSRLSLLEDAKELKEHRLVVEALKDRLAEFGRVEVALPEVMSLPTLEHLKSVVKVRLSADPCFESLVKALHPTPALGTWPPQKGLEYLARLDHRHELRNKFGAPFGVRFSENEFHCLVAIRNIQWSERGSYLFAGCGVIGQSEVQREWQELALKRQSVKQILGLNP